MKSKLTGKTSEPNSATSSWRVDSQDEHAKIFRHMELHGLPDSVIDMTAIPSGAEPPPPCGSLRESMPVTETPRRTALSGPKPGPRNGPTLQHLPLLRRGGWALPADGPARAGGGINYAYRPNPSIWIDQLCLKCSLFARNPKQLHASIKDKWDHGMAKRDMRELQSIVDRIKLNNPVILMMEFLSVIPILWEILIFRV